MIGSFRKLKFLLNRKTLSKIYTVFIRPHFEYACEVWDGCSIEQADKLERLQLEAARIVTGLPRYASSQSLYFETGWELLSERRRVRKLMLFHKIHKGLAPSFLHDLLPPMGENRTSYKLRNCKDYSTPRTRLRHSTLSFFPSTINLWNKIPLETRDSDSVNSFRSGIHIKQKCAPVYFSYGKRKLNILHTRLRHISSTLNYDLFRINVKNDACCQCGNKCENVFHYFLECPRYNVQRAQMLKSIDYVVHQRAPIDINLILNGSAGLSLIENQNVFKCLHLYICNTKRFL